MGDVPLETEAPAFVNHPLWSRFLRWCTIRPKRHEIPSSSSLRSVSQETLAKLDQLNEYQYVPMPNPISYIRLASLQPGDFDEDEVAVKLQHHVLAPPTQKPPDRMTLMEIRKDLPPGWEAFQTIVENRFFFRDLETGHVQWEHPDPRFHIERYQVPPRNKGVVPRYETVSYVWGSPHKNSVIRVDTPEGSYKLPVTQSLATVLRYLRRTDTERTLWIDAICLNQSDYEELSRQVPRMYDIYRLAHKGTLWLGREDASSKETLQTFRYLGNQVVAEAGTGLLFCSPDAEKKDWYDPDVDIPYSSETWNGIKTMLQRPWFFRLWVIQEIQPGAEVRCGHDVVPVAAFTEAVYCLYSKAKLPGNLRQHLEQATGTMARLPALCFTRLLYRASTFKACTDPRDKIYGLLGLAPRKFANSVNVDYEASNSAADVFAMTVVNHAQISERLEHFHNCIPNTETMRGAPTWVPDWYSELPYETYIPALFATNTSRAHYSVTYTTKDGKERPYILKVQGLHVATITSTTEPLPLRLPTAEAISHVRKWAPNDLDSSDYPLAGERLRKAYAMTLNCSIVKEREPDWLLSTTDEWIAQDFPQALFGDKAEITLTEADGRRDVLDALQCCAGRLFFRTQEGYGGLGPADTKEGDRVVVLLGCSTPLVLRPSDRGSQHFSVVGECFVYGLHDAISLLGPLPEGWQGMAAWEAGDRRVLRFLNTATQSVTNEDPRLEARDLGPWERVEKLIDGDDPTNFDIFKHRETGETINYDPRLEPEKLEEKGVGLEWFSLV